MVPGLDPQIAGRLLGWMDTVLAANRRQNLTRIIDEQAFVQNHILDSLAGLPMLPEAGTVVDVGSGAGFPGVVLALARPALRVTLLESSRRKARFLESSDLPVVWARAEDYARGAGRDAFDVAVSRAVAPLAVVLELVLPLVRPGGSAVLWLGHGSEGEDAVASRVSALLGARSERVAASPSPGRRFRIFAKIGSTPERFPRRSGVATRRPL
jgi:16S rRNA (guanine527-N7)-methyltransferase